MTLRREVSLLCLAAILGLSTIANAALTTIGSASYRGNSYNLIYDADSPFGPITWLDYTRKSSYSWENTWENNVSWASGLGGPGASLTVTLLPGYTSANDWSTGWRLPSTVDGPLIYSSDGSTSLGYNTTTSEMGHLYYTELGNKGYNWGNTQSGYGLVNQGPFTNLQMAGYELVDQELLINLQIACYWSGTEFALWPSHAWYFNTSYGNQDENAKGDLSINFYALAVHSGKVAPVPLPGAILLFGAGLAGICAVKRRMGRHW